MLERAAQAGVIYGSKAVGEPPLMLAISVREAIREAIAAFGGKPDFVPLALPATPEATLFAIENVRSILPKEMLQNGRGELPEKSTIQKDEILSPVS